MRCLSFPVAARSKALNSGRTLEEIADSNPAECMDICPFFMLCVVRVLCDGLITRRDF